MSKKIFTVLLLAVFMLAQFSIASAAPVAGAEGTLVTMQFVRARCYSRFAIAGRKTSVTSTCCAPSRCSERRAQRQGPATPRAAARR